MLPFKVSAPPRSKSWKPLLGLIPIFFVILTFNNITPLPLYNIYSIQKTSRTWTAISGFVLNAAKCSCTQSYFCELQCRFGVLLVSPPIAFQSLLHRISRILYMVLHIPLYFTCLKIVSFIFGMNEEGFEY